MLQCQLRWHVARALRVLPWLPCSGCCTCGCDLHAACAACCCPVNLSTATTTSTNLAETAVPDHQHLDELLAPNLVGARPAGAQQRLLAEGAVIHASSHGAVEAVEALRGCRTGGKGARARQHAQPGPGNRAGQLGVLALQGMREAAVLLQQYVLVDRLLTTVADCCCCCTPDVMRLVVGTGSVLPLPYTSNASAPGSSSNSGEKNNKQQRLLHRLLPRPACFLLCPCTMQHAIS